jgi:hypothetical protein
VRLQGVEGAPVKSPSASPSFVMSPQRTTLTTMPNPTSSAVSLPASISACPTTSARHTGGSAAFAAGARRASAAAASARASLVTARV